MKPSQLKTLSKLAKKNPEMCGRGLKMVYKDPRHREEIAKQIGLDLKWIK